MQYTNRSANYLIIFCLYYLLLFCISCQWETETSPTPTTAPVNTSAKSATKIKTPKFKADSAFYYIQKQVDFGPRVPGTAEHKACANWLEQTLGRFSDEIMIQKAEVRLHDSKKVPMYNVIGSFNPSANKRILLCAHWDTRPVADQDTERADEPILGANDGASGVGVLLEIARQLQNHPIELGIDIIFFDVEDAGESSVEDSYCLGSQYWGRNLHKPNYKADFGILLDMVGASNGTFYQEGTSVHFASVVVNKIWNTAEELGYESYFPKQRVAAITDDHLYVNELTRIPTVDIIHYTQQGFGKFWHTHNDNMKIISKQTLKAVGQTVLEVIYRENKQVIQ